MGAGTILVIFIQGLNKTTAPTHYDAEMQSDLHSLEMIATYRLPAVQFRTASPN